MRVPERVEVQETVVVREREREVRPWMEEEPGDEPVSDKTRKMEPVVSEREAIVPDRKIGRVRPVSYTHLTLPTTPYV